MTVEVLPRQKQTIRCPVNGPVDTIWVRTDCGDYNWCLRSGLVCAVDECKPVCPLEDSLEVLPVSASWACPTILKKRRA